LQAGSLSGLSDQERNFWNENGYLLVPGALAPHEIEEYLHSTDELVARGKRRALAALSGVEAQDQKFQGVLFRSDGFDALLDHRGVFGKVLALMGPYISVLGTDVLVRYPRPSGEVESALHTDGGPSMQKILPQEQGFVLQLKVQYFFTNVLDENCGNFSVVPGSHKRSFPHRHDTNRRGIEMRQLRCSAGDAIVFPWSLWHAAAPNTVGEIRKSAIIRYGQLWCRPMDYQVVPSQVLQRLTIRQQRLVGHFEGEPSPNDYYGPSDKDQLSIILGDEWTTDPNLVSLRELDDYFRKNSGVRR
jgi:hypothetical protein